MPDKARRTVAVSVVGYLAFASHVRPSPAVCACARACVGAGVRVCVNTSCVCLFGDASVGYPILPMDTEDSSQYAVLKLFASFHMATVSDQCLTAI